MSPIRCSLAAMVLAAAMSHIGAAEMRQTADTLDVCALLPKEEAAKVLGRSIPRARPGKRSDGGLECRYMPPLEGTITVMVAGPTSKAEWDKFMKELTEAGAKLEPVAGVGNGANFWDDHRLYAHASNYQITVSTTPTPGLKPEKVRADAVKLAQALIPKLPKR